MGIEGMCVGETRLVRIPPELAFDDPQKRFKKKPVKTGSVGEIQTFREMPFPHLGNEAAGI